MSLNKSSMAWLDSLLLFTSFTSLALNGVLVIGNYRRGARRWATDGILITMTAFLDCLMSICIIWATLSRLVDPSLVYDGSRWCHITFICGRILGMTCLNLVMYLSLVRYLVIVRHRNSNPRFWTILAILTVLSIAVITVLRYTDPDLRVFPSGVYCSVVSQDATLGISLVSNALYLFSFPPLFVVPFCYAKVSSHYARLISICESDLHVVRKMRGKIAGIILVTLAYWLAVIPGVLLYFAIRLFDLVPSPTIDGLVYWLLTSVALINGIFPIFFHNEIRASVVDMFSPKRSLYQNQQLY
ncbi:hypothetical protein DSO57_1030681 [Entomophthora muscae]|uniref:Uncharacterized protein n=1 Tax=Entomophthora muscae TaxID=34485 RepID=A0ACC2S3A2_9FUNG|nr:hypothetical protein DSO57_1030681 [Entomophthora muscae]